MIGYLLDPAIQVQNENGVTIPGARLYIYNHNTSDLAETYKDFEGTRNTNPVITDTLGNCTVIAEDGISYDVVFKDEEDNLLFSKQNITVTQGGSSSGNVQVTAGYGIEVTPSISAGIQKYEVAIDPTIVETFDSITKYVAGDNIVLNDLPNNEKSINLANEVILSENNYQSKLNTKQNSFTNTSANKGSIQDAAGFYVSDVNQTEFTDISKNYIQIVGPSTATIGKRLYEQNNLLQIDYTDNGNSTYKTLSATPDDVTIWRHRGSGPAEYSLTGACTSAQLAYASVLSGDLTPYSAGANINITNNVVSGKDWTNTINSATSGKLNTSTFNTYTAAHTADDVTPYSAGSNINITNHVISGKNWSNDILAATSGKIDKVTGGAGSTVNPVYLDASNIIRPCFSSDSVKFASSALPNYFAGDLAGNTFIYNVEGNSSTTAYSIRNSIIVGNSNNFQRSTNSHEHFDKCIFMGGAYMYGATGSSTLTNNIIIGRNSISEVASDSNYNTIIGNNNDIMCNDLGICKFNTIGGYENNIWGIGQTCTIYGSNNDINAEHLNFSGSNISIFGYNNKWQPKSNSVYESIIVGDYNNIEQSGNYRTMAVGFSNTISGNNTTLIGNDLSANNEGSYEDQVMKVGFGKCHLEIHSNGIIYKVVNGTKTQI